MISQSVYICLRDPRNKHYNYFYLLLYIAKDAFSVVLDCMPFGKNDSYTSPGGIFLTLSCLPLFRYTYCFKTLLN